MRDETILGHFGAYNVLNLKLSGGCVVRVGWGSAAYAKISLIGGKRIFLPISGDGEGKRSSEGIS